MQKEELIYLTLKQLLYSLDSSPQNFRLEDPELGSNNGHFPGPTIIWQFKCEIQPGVLIQDPLNASRTIIVTYHKLSNNISCHIYFREVNSMNSAIMADSQAVQPLHKFKIVNRNWRLFEKLRKKLIKMKREQEYIDYLKKLNNIFPSTHIDELLE